MKGKIAFEEHMSLPETLEDARTFAGGSGKWDEFARQILAMTRAEIQIDFVDGMIRQQQILRPRRAHLQRRRGIGLVREDREPGEV